MNIAVTGEKGRLGGYLVEKHGCMPFGWLSPNEATIRRRIYELGHPDVIIHCAAVTDVDGCEGELFDKALMTNWYLTRALRRMYSGRIIYISTDYVFDGVRGPYSEDMKTNPINHYGYTKMCGERVMVMRGAVDDCIVRTTQLFGGGKEDFVSRIVDGLKSGKAKRYSLRIFGSPTYIPDLSKALLELAAKESVPAIVNISGYRVYNRHYFARLVADKLKLNCKSIFPSNRFRIGDARRPLHAGLRVDRARKLGLTIRDPLDGVEELYS